MNPPLPKVPEETELPFPKRNRVDKLAVEPFTDRFNPLKFEPKELLKLNTNFKSVNVAGIELKVIEDAALVSSCLAISCIFLPS
jgi:hypothetical protein